MKVARKQGKSGYSLTLRPRLDGSRRFARSLNASLLTRLGDGHVLEQLALVARLPHGVETVVHDLRIRRRGGQRNERREARSRRAATFFSMMDRSRQAVPWETTAARPRGGKVRSGTGGGGAYLFADERAGDDDGDVHARALREERRRGTGRSRSDSFEGVRVYFVVGAARVRRGKASDPGARDGARTDIAVL